MNEEDLTLDANDLIKGAKAPDVVATPPKQSPVDFVGRFEDTPKSANDYITRLDTEEARKRDDILSRLIEAPQQDTGQVYQNTFNQQAQQLTGQSGDNLIQRLRDENTKLATLQGQFRTQAQRVSGAQGQSKVFEAPQLNELERERAVQVGNQAILVQALQGNVETARQIALDTANFVTQDRKAELDTLITQYNAVQGLVSGQERQVIEAKKAEAEAEKAELERTQKSVDGAILSGVATPEEMQQLTSTRTDNATKQALAQQILARGAGEDRQFTIEDRALDKQYKQAQIQSQNALTEERLNKIKDEQGGPAAVQAAIEYQVPTFEDYVAERQEELGMTLAPAAREALRDEYESDVELARRSIAVNLLSPLAAEMLRNPKNFFTLTATKKGEVLEELANAGIDTGQIQDGKRRPLTATQTDDLAQAQLAMDGVTKLKTMLDKLHSNGPIIGRLREKNPYDPQVVAIEAEINRILPGLARGIFKEVGVLTDTDIERYRKTLANPRATDKQIEQLHEDTMDKVVTSIENVLDIYERAGYDVAQFDIDDFTGGTATEIPTEAVDILAKYNIPQ